MNRQSLLIYGCFLLASCNSPVKKPNPPSNITQITNSSASSLTALGLKPSTTTINATPLMPSVSLVAQALHSGGYSVYSDSKPQSPQLIYADDKIGFYYQPQDSSTLIKINFSNKTEISLKAENNFHPFSDSLKKITNPSDRSDYNLDQTTEILIKYYEINQGTFRGRPHIDSKGNIYVLGTGLFPFAYAAASYDHFRDGVLQGANVARAPYSSIGIYVYSPTGQIIDHVGIPGFHLNGQVDSKSLQGDQLALVGINNSEIFLKDNYNGFGKITKDGHFNRLYIEKLMPDGAKIQNIEFDRKNNIWVLSNARFGSYESNWGDSVGSLYKFDTNGKLLTILELATSNNKLLAGYGTLTFGSQKIIFDRQENVILPFNEKLAYRFESKTGQFLDQIALITDVDFYGASSGPVVYGSGGKFYTYASVTKGSQYIQKLFAFSFLDYLKYNDINPIKLHVTSYNSYVLDDKNDVVHIYENATGKYRTYWSGFDGVKNMYLVKRNYTTGDGDLLIIEDKNGKKVVGIDGGGLLYEFIGYDQSKLIIKNGFIAQYRESTKEFFLSLDWMLNSPTTETPYNGFKAVIQPGLSVDSHTETVIDKNAELYQEKVAYLKWAPADAWWWRYVVQTSPNSLQLLSGAYQSGGLAFWVTCPGTTCRGMNEKKHIDEYLFFPTVTNLPASNNANIVDFKVDDAYFYIYYLDQKNKTISKYNPTDKRLMWENSLQ